MKKQHYYLFFLILLSFSKIQAQDLHIYYDVQNDTIISYRMNGNEKLSPIAKMGHNIFLHLENFNKYLFSATVSIDSENISNLDNTSIPKIVDAKNIMSKVFESFGIPSVKKSEKITKEDDDSTLGFGDNNEDDGVPALVEELIVIESRINSVSDSLVEIINTGKSRVIAINEINKMRINPYLHPKSIQKLSKELLEYSLQVSNKDELDISKLQTKYKSASKIADKLKKLKTHRTDYLQKVKEIANHKSKESSSSKTRDDAISKIIDDAKVVDARVLKYINDVEAITPIIVESEQLEKLIQLRTEYEIVSNKKDLTKTFRIPADKDLTKITLSLIPKDTTIVGMPKITQMINPIKVSVSGGVKVNLSGGFSFGGFAQSPTSYFVRDSIIHAGKKDHFTPFLTTFFHYYKQSATNTSYALSFGIGVPLDDVTNIKSPVFFFGPSLILGKSNRMVISSGVMSARVSNLGEGYEVGDEFIINETNKLPLSDHYQFGGFLGVSYNLW